MDAYIKKHVSSMEVIKHLQYWFLPTSASSRSEMILIRGILVLLTEKRQRGRKREMEISCASASMASWLPSKPPSASYVSMASCSSVFFSNVGGGLQKRRIGLFSERKSRRSGAAAVRGLGCRCLFGLGVPELVVIAGVAALIFGPKKLPEIGRGIGKTMKSFQQAAKEFETELKKDPENAGNTPPPPTDGPKAIIDEDENDELQKKSIGKEST